MSFLALSLFPLIHYPIKHRRPTAVLEGNRCRAVQARARQEYEHTNLFSEADQDYISSLQNATDDNALQHLSIEDETRLVRVTSGVMAKITGLESVGLSTLAAEAVLPKPALFKSWKLGEMKRLLVLEGCQDPGNLGTLLRTALAFGWDGAFLLPGCADPFNEKAIRASRGACFKIPVESGDIGDWLEICNAHGLTRIAATSSSTKTDLRPHHENTHLETYDWERFKECSASLVLGSEGQGLSDDVLELCDSVSIPMAGAMESLNVASAGAILMCVLSQSIKRLMSDLTLVMKE